MIVKDEAAMLQGCLKSIEPLRAELIVVDTGSSDGTKVIAKKSGAKVYDFEWSDDFSNARNFSISKATRDWILVLDADEMLEPRDCDAILKLTGSPGYDAYSLLQRTYTDNSLSLDFVEAKRYGFAGYFDVEVVRLFRNGNDYAYYGRVHELLDDSLKKNQARIARTDVLIHHLEHMKGEETIKRKQLHYLELCKKEVESRPQDEKLLCDIALLSFYYAHDGEFAQEMLRKAIAAHPDSARPLMLVGQIYAAQGNKAEAIKAYQLASGLEGAPKEAIAANIAKLRAD